MYFSLQGNRFLQVLQKYLCFSFSNSGSIEIEDLIETNLIASSTTVDLVQQRPQKNLFFMSA
jgi:hypothetical protein